MASSTAPKPSDPTRAVNAAPAAEPVAPGEGRQVVQAPSEADKIVAPFITEGTRAELEQFGEARDPFTGKQLTRADLPKQK